MAPFISVGIRTRRNVAGASAVDRIQGEWAMTFRMAMTGRDALRGGAGRVTCNGVRNGAEAALSTNLSTTSRRFLTAALLAGALAAPTAARTGASWSTELWVDCGVFIDGDQAFGCKDFRTGFRACSAGLADQTFTY